MQCYLLVQHNEISQNAPISNGGGLSVTDSHRQLADILIFKSELGRFIWIKLLYINMDPSQMMYAVLRWTTDDNKLSIEHMRVIVDPKISYNDYLPGDQCTAKFGPSSKLYPVTIVAVGRK